MEISPGPTQGCQNKPPAHEKNGTDTKENKNLSILCSSTSDGVKMTGSALVIYICGNNEDSSSRRQSFQYSECRAWKACLIRGCVKQCCCGTPPGAAESFTAVSQSLGLWLTTSGVNWRDKPSSIQALNPLWYYSSLSHATWGANWATASKKSHTQATLNQSSSSQAIDMYGNTSQQTTTGLVCVTHEVMLDIFRWSNWLNPFQSSIAGLYNQGNGQCDNTMTKRKASGWALLNFTLAELH